MIALAWAIPAALHGGDEYAHAIFLSQTFDRIQGVKTGTHAQPIWWYLVWLPVMLLPWPLLLRGRASMFQDLFRERGARLALAWVLPTLIVFSLIGGKQAHYLLPLLPGIGLLFAIAVERAGFEVRVGAAAVVLLAAGVALALLPQRRGLAGESCVRLGHVAVVGRRRRGNRHRAARVARNASAIRSGLRSRRSRSCSCSSSR